MIRPLSISLPQPITPPHPLSITALSNISNFDSEIEFSQALPVQSQEEIPELLTAEELRVGDKMSDQGLTNLVSSRDNTTAARVAMEEEALKEEAVEVHTAAAAAAAASLITQS